MASLPAPHSSALYIALFFKKSLSPLTNPDNVLSYTAGKAGAQIGNWKLCPFFTTVSLEWRAVPGGALGKYLLDDEWRNWVPSVTGSWCLLSSDKHRLLIKVLGLNTEASKKRPGIWDWWLRSVFQAQPPWPGHVLRQVSHLLSLMFLTWKVGVIARIVNCYYMEYNIFYKAPGT